MNNYWNMNRLHHEHCHVSYCQLLLCGKILTVIYCQDLKGIGAIMHSFAKHTPLPFQYCHFLRVIRFITYNTSVSQFLDSPVLSFSLHNRLNASPRQSAEPDLAHLVSNIEDQVSRSRWDLNLRMADQRSCILPTEITGLHFFFS